MRKAAMGKLKQGKRAPASAVAVESLDSDDVTERIGDRDAALAAGTTEHYEDAILYDHEYRRRRVDVNYYRDLAAGRVMPNAWSRAQKGKSKSPAQRHDSDMTD